MEEIAQVYARSLFEVAEELGLLDAIREQLSQFADALSENRELATFFFSPYFSTEEKKDALHRAIEGAEPTFMSFLEALVERHRMPAIFRIRARYEAMWDDANQLLPVQVTSATRPSRLRLGASSSWNRPGGRSRPRPGGQSMRFAGRSPT